MKSNSQVVITCMPAAFVLIKSNLDNHLKKTPVTNITQSRDCLVKHTNKPDGDPLYTINYFNTTSGILVNRTKDVLIFLTHYHTVLILIHKNTESSINKAIKVA